MAKTVFNQEKVDFTKQDMFFGADQNTQRYDVFKFPVFDKLNQTMLGYFWRPEEVKKVVCVMLKRNCTLQ